MTTGTIGEADAPPDSAAQQEFALVRVGGALCALPHEGQNAGGSSSSGRFLLKRIVPWRVPTPIPGTPRPLILGVAPLNDEEGIERVEVVVDLACALGMSSSARDHSTCILIYSDGDLTAGFVVDALLRKTRLAQLQSSSDLPFTQALVLQPRAPRHNAAGRDTATAMEYEEWRVVDVTALLRHLLVVLKVPGVA